MKNKSISKVIHFNRYMLSVCLLLILLFGNIPSISSQDTDTTELLRLLESDIDGDDRLEYLLQLSDVLNAEKSYTRLSEYAMEAFQVANALKDDNSRIEACYYLVRSAYYLREYDKCGYYGNLGINIAENLPPGERLAYFYNVLGIIQRRMGDCSTAIEYYNKAIAVNQAIADSARLASNYNNLSVCYKSQGEYNLSYGVLQKGLAIRKALKDTNGMANIHINLGNHFEGLSKFEDAIENYITAFTYYEAQDNKRMIASSLFNIGLVYQDLEDYKMAKDYYYQAMETIPQGDMDDLLGYILQNIGNIDGKEKNYVESIRNQKKALALFEKLESYTDMSKANLNIGLQFMKMEELDSARYYLGNALEISQESPESYGFANTNLELGRLFIYQKNWNLAKKYLELGKSVAEQRNDLELTSYANEYLYEFYNAQGDIARALEFYRTYRTQRDSINVMEQEQAVTRIKSQYDFEKQEAEIELLNAENQLQEIEVEKAAQQRNLLFALLALMASIAGGISFQFWYSYKKNLVIKKEKEKAEELLLNILPEEAAEELTEKGTVQAKRFDKTTVLFTDFVNFSKYAENVDPSEVVKSVDFYFSKFDRIVEKHGLEKIKTIGDAYMCAAGLPNPENNDPASAIKAAKEILDIVNELIQTPPEGIHPFEIRIGINTGPVVAGIVGIHKFQYDIWGDTVNIAARMESNCDTGKINISEDTYAFIKDDFDCTYRGEAEIKNHGKIKMYYVAN